MCIGELRAEATAVRKRHRPHATVIPSQRKFVVAMQTADAAAAKSDNCFHGMVLSRVHHIFIKPPCPLVNCHIFITIIRVPYN